MAEIKLLKQLEELTAQMKMLNSRVEAVEKELGELKSPNFRSSNFDRNWQSGHRWGNRSTRAQTAENSGSSSKTDGTKVKEPLNEGRSPPKGQ